MARSGPEELHLRTSRRGRARRSRPAFGRHEHLAGVGEFPPPRGSGVQSCKDRRPRLIRVAWCPPRRDNRGVTETNVELARHGFEAALRGDLDAIRELLDTDVKWHGDPSAAGCCPNREQALEFMRKGTQPSTRRRARRCCRRWRQVVVIKRPPSYEGEQATLSANLTTFRDGKVVETVHYPKPEDALAAAGV
jgi:hypothetical protein